jgi:probable F420-dependent oxidoreductase
MEPEDPILDPFVALAFAAAATTSIRLATGIVILPQRNPLVLAKQIATLDVLSGGRFTLGLGVGYLEPEMTAIGVPMERRGARADDYLAAMRALWENEPPVAHGGSFVSFAGVDAHPRPVQKPIPVVAGGHTAAAHRRAARSADGWYGFALDVETTRGQVASLREQAEREGRDPATIEVSVSPSQRLDAETVAAYADAGADRLVALPRPNIPLDKLEEFIRRNAPGELGASAARADAFPT